MNISFLSAQEYLKSADIILHTIPGEEWRLSQKDIVIHLTRTIQGKQSSYHNNDLFQVLLMILLGNRKIRQELPEALEAPNIVILSKERKAKRNVAYEDHLAIAIREGSLLIDMPQDYIWQLAYNEFGPLYFVRIFYKDEYRGTTSVSGHTLQEAIARALFRDIKVIEHPTQLSKIVSFTERFGK